MGFFGKVKKKLKKRIRLKRGLLTLGAIILLIGCGIGYFANETGLSAQTTAFAAFLHQPPHSPEQIRQAAAVTLRRIFVCGNEEHKLGIKSPEDITALAAAHPEWTFEAKSARSVTFIEHVDDLSEECKQNSYIGIDAFGNLSLFRGLPKEQKAVKTFFQLDIEFLESSLPNETVSELRNGIRVNDIAEYHSVISTFSDYAIEEVEKVIKPGL